MLEYRAAFIRIPRFRDDGVVHDGEGDGVDEVVGHSLDEKEKSKISRVWDVKKGKREKGRG